MSKESIKQAVEAAQSVFAATQTRTHFDFSPETVSPEWPQLKPLVRQLPPAKAFPVDSLGPILAGAAKSIQYAVQAPMAMCSQCVLSAATLAVQPLADVLIDGRKHPISNFYLTLGESGERKSTVDGWALRAHRDFEKEKAIQFEREFAGFLSKKEFYEDQRKALTRKGRSTPHEIESSVEALGPRPEEPLEPWILAKDPTIEGLVRMFLKGQPSIGLFSDEGGLLFGGYSLNKDHLVQGIASFSCFWDGAVIDRIRGTDGSMKLRGRRFSMHLMAQPKIAGLLLGNELVQSQGLLARMLLIYPETTAGTRSYQNVDLSREHAMLSYWNQIRDCLNENQHLVEGSRNELEPRSLVMSSDAKELWVAFYNTVEQELGEGGKYRGIRAFACKAAEHCLRLAAVLTLIEEPRAVEISVERIDAAILLTDFYLEENLRLTGNGSSPSEDMYEECARLFQWLQNQMQRCGARISVEQVYKTGPRSSRKAKKAREQMELLAAHNFVRRCTDVRDEDEIFEIRELDSS